jgi:hypothetical protein
MVYFKLVIGLSGFLALGYNLVDTWPTEESRHALVDSHPISHPTLVGGLGYSLSENGTPTHQVQRPTTAP